MARKRKDKTHERALNSIKLAFELPGFWESLNVFKSSWKACGYSNVTEDRDKNWDESRRQMVYTGLYYDLREFCDCSGIDWPYGGGLIMRILNAMEKGDNVLEALQPDDCPPSRDWQWFRMARCGLGLPRDNELNTVPKMSPHGRKRNLTGGLTYEDIAEQFGVDERTVRNAVTRCWQYLKRGGINFNRIADLAGLRGGEELLSLVTALIMREYESELKTGKIKS